MEEAWELAALGFDMQTDWSSRHTRLRYQAVLSSLVGLMSVLYGIKTVTIPSVVEFQSSPENWMVQAGLLAFAFFSTISFFVQHRIESQKFPISAGNLLEELRAFEDAYIGLNAAYGKFGQQAKSAYSNLSNSDISDKGYKWLHGEEGEVLRGLGSLVHLIQQGVSDFQGLESELTVYFPGRFSKLVRLEKALARFNKALESASPKQLSTGNVFADEKITKYGMPEHQIDKALEQLKVSELLQSEAKTILDDVRRDLMFQKWYQYTHSRFLSFLLPFLMACSFMFSAFVIWALKS